LVRSDFGIEINLYNKKILLYLQLNTMGAGQMVNGILTGKEELQDLVMNI